MKKGEGRKDTFALLMISLPPLTKEHRSETVEFLSKLNEMSNSKVIIFGENHTSPKAHHLHFVLLREFAEKGTLIYLDESLNAQSIPDNIIHHLPLQDFRLSNLYSILLGLTRIEEQKIYDGPKAIIESYLKREEGILPRATVFVLKLRLLVFPLIYDTIRSNTTLLRACFPSILDVRKAREKLLAMKEQVDSLFKLSNALSVTSDTPVKETKKIAVFTTIIEELYAMNDDLERIYRVMVRHILSDITFPKEEGFFIEKILAYLDGDEDVAHPQHVVSAWRTLYMAKSIIVAREAFAPLNIFVKVGQAHLIDNTEKGAIGILTLLSKQDPPIEAQIFHIT